MSAKTMRYGTGHLFFTRRPPCTVSICLFAVKSYTHTHTRARVARCPPSSVAAARRKPRPRYVCAPRLSPVIGLAAGGATRTARGGFYRCCAGGGGVGRGIACGPPRPRGGPVSRVPPGGRRGRYYRSTPSCGRSPATAADDDGRHFTARVHVARTLFIPPATDSDHSYQKTFIFFGAPRTQATWTPRAADVVQSVCHGRIALRVGTVGLATRSVLAIFSSDFIIIIHLMLRYSHPRKPTRNTLSLEPPPTRVVPLLPLNDKKSFKPLLLGAHQFTSPVPAHANCIFLPYNIYNKWIIGSNKSNKNIGNNLTIFRIFIYFDTIWSHMKNVRLLNYTCKITEQYIICMTIDILLSDEKIVSFKIKPHTFLSFYVPLSLP
ncbi:hypothetical protein QTP88_015091 [Uroleucon formosanum]